jgi:hypothetical protein
MIFDNIDGEIIFERNYTAISLIRSKSILAPVDYLAFSSPSAPQGPFYISTSLAKFWMKESTIL